MLYVGQSRKLLFNADGTLTSLGKPVGILEKPAYVSRYTPGAMLYWAPNEGAGTDPYSPDSYMCTKSFDTETEAMRWAERYKDYIVAGHAV